MVLNRLLLDEYSAKIENQLINHATTMKRTLAMAAKHILLLLAVLIASTLQAADEAVPKSMIGHWEGNARIIVDWCKQQQLHVAIDINSNGSITGKVGDATLTHGQFTSNRGWIGRKLNLATDYIIRGDLTGPIVSAEDITRPSVSIPLNFSNGSFVGGIHTSGSKLGDKKDMPLSAAVLKLTQK